MALCKEEKQAYDCQYWHLLFPGLQNSFSGSSVVGKIFLPHTKNFEFGLKIFSRKYSK